MYLPQAQQVLYSAVQNSAHVNTWWGEAPLSTAAATELEASAIEAWAA